MNLNENSYDVIILDEGHKVKNVETMFRRDIAKLKVKGHRLVLSGTPLQNHLSELWSVFDFVQPKIFGSFNKFQKEYAQKIEKGLLKNANRKEKEQAQKVSEHMRFKYEDFFLRRTKANIF